MCEAAPDPQESVKKSEVIQAAPQKKPNYNIHPL